MIFSISSLLHGLRNKLLIVLFGKKLLKLFVVKNFSPIGFDELSFEFSFFAMEEKNELNPSAISRLLLTNSPSTMNDALSLGLRHASIIHASIINSISA